ncbi:hypothetical protein NPIL_251091 [Nephila pilipes]|uniref:Uncharacterized protein n=1 Tax=Nephila pilipes TaxID=299642 RepID=A0A8X6MQB7_NEPPI|nr:hypothetical protein NPIL_251091 [Nephila pilipes]
MMENPHPLEIHSNESVDKETGEEESDSDYRSDNQNKLAPVDDVRDLLLSGFLCLYFENVGKRDRSSVGLNDMEAPRQSSSRGPVACFWITNRKYNALLWAPKMHGAHRQSPTPPNK